MLLKTIAMCLGMAGVLSVAPLVSISMASEASVVSSRATTTGSSAWDAELLYEQNEIARSRIRSIEYRAKIVWSERGDSGEWMETPSVVEVRRQDPLLFVRAERTVKQLRKLPESAGSALDIKGQSVQNHRVLIRQEDSVLWSDGDEFATKVDHSRPDEMSEGRREALEPYLPEDLLLFGFGNGQGTIRNDREALLPRTQWRVAVEPGTSLVRVDVLHPDGAPERTLWFDPSKDFIVVKHVTFDDKGEKRRETLVEASRLDPDGVVVPTRVEQTTYAAADVRRARAAGENVAIRKKVIEVSVVSVNREFGEAGFNVGLLQLPPTVPVLRKLQNGITETERAVGGEIVPWEVAGSLLAPSQQGWQPKSSAEGASSTPSNVLAASAGSSKDVSPTHTRQWVASAAIIAAAFSAALVYFLRYSKDRTKTT